MTDETQKTPGSSSESSPPPDDDWGFLASRKEQVQPVEKPVKRAAGEFRGEMAGGVSLKRRAWPMALSLALVSVAGFLTEAVGATQIVSLAGPTVEDYEWEQLRPIKAQRATNAVRAFLLDAYDLPPENPVVARILERSLQSEIV